MPSGKIRTTNKSTDMCSEIQENLEIFETGNHLGNPGLQTANFKESIL